MNNSSRTNSDKVNLLTEEGIDTSDIPLLTEEFFSIAHMKRSLSQ
ncbi:hypothetical protein [Nostoc sp. LPT]|nr:hypothetical protein [Nostoc sp. LPT]